MQLTYALQAEDYLHYQLYAANHSPLIRRARLRSWIIMTLAFLSLAYLFYREQMRLPAVYFTVLAVVSAGLYPLYSRWRYQRHYRKHVQVNFQSQLGEPTTLELTDTVLVALDRASRSEVKIRELYQLVETSQAFLLRYTSTYALLIPKNQVDAAAVASELRRLARLNGVPYLDHQDWRWK